MGCSWPALRSAVLAGLAGLAGLGCAGREWSSLHDVAPGVVEEIRYHGTHNFVGRPIEGYRAPKCLLTRKAAEALAKVQESAIREGYSLKVYDCYRPARAVADFVAWARDLGDQKTKSEFYPHVPKEELFGRGYIAEKSGHSRGSTVDLTLVRVEDGSPVEMGTPYDFFDPAAHTDAPGLPAATRANRDRLRRLMQSHGFRNLPEEWWHYTLVDEPFPDRYFDFEVR